LLLTTDWRRRHRFVKHTFVLTRVLLSSVGP
jgi:hypothetical protein